jgi:hypothetical protein
MLAGHLFVNISRVEFGKWTELLCFAVVNAGIAGCCTGLALSFPGIYSEPSVGSHVPLDRTAVIP